MEPFDPPVEPIRAEPRSRRTATFTKIGNNSFVSDLFWQALERPRNYMAEAKEIGKRDGLDIVAIRDTITVKQAGFVRKSDGALKGMYSLAAALAGQLGDTWIGAFKLPDGQYAMVAVDQGAIIPSSDIIADKAAVLKHFRKIYSRGTTDFKDQVYAPAEFEFGGVEKDIEVLLDPSVLKKEYRLRPLTFGLTKKELIQLAIAGVVVLIGAIGYFQWKAYEEEQLRIARAQAAAAEAARLAELNKQTRGEQAAPALKHPWATMAGVGDFVTECSAALDSKPTALGGWRGISANCSKELFAITYARDGVATVNQFRQSAAGLFELAPAFTEGGDKASLNEPLVMKLAGDEELLPLDDLLSNFNSHFQQVLIKPELAEVPYVAPAPPAPLPGEEPGATPPAPPLPDWVEFSFSIRSDIPPQILAQGMPSRGVRITDIEVIRTDSSRLSWTIKGALYAKKKQ